MTLFSVRKECGHRVISILGLKIKLRDKSYNLLEDFCQIENLNYFEKQGTRFPHPIGIVLHKNTKVGRNCIIYQNVTIGAKNVKDGDINKPDNYPIIGDNVTIYAGAVIVGPITVGNNAVIGANAVVFNDIPENAVVVGANKIIKTQYKS